MLSLVIIFSNQRDVVGVEIPHFTNTSLERNVLHAVMCLNPASVARRWSRSAKGSCWKTGRLGLIVVPWDAAEHLWKNKSAPSNEYSQRSSAAKCTWSVHIFSVICGDNAVRPGSEQIKVHVMCLSCGVINQAARAAIMSGIISEAALVSLGIN